MTNRQTDILNYLFIYYVYIYLYLLKQRIIESLFDKFIKFKKYLKWISRKPSSKNQQKLMPR